MTALALERAGTSPAETPDADKLDEFGESLSDLAEDGEETQAELAQVGERLARVEQLTENVSRLSEVL